MDTLNATSADMSTRGVAISILSAILGIPIVLLICLASMNCFATHTIYRGYQYIFWCGTALGAVWLIRRIGDLRSKKNAHLFLVLTIGPFGLGGAAAFSAAFLMDAAILVSAHKMASFETPVHIYAGPRGCLRAISFYDVNVGRSIAVCADNLASPNVYKSKYGTVTDAVGWLGAKVVSIDAAP
jgi:hypothetical protein